MRRALLVCLMLAAGAAWVLTSAGAGDGDGPARYKVELDNAFGLVDGADVSVQAPAPARITMTRSARLMARAAAGRDRS